MWLQIWEHHAVFNTATLLPNGKVLLAGGYDELEAPFGAAELYDPVTGAYTPTGSMGTARVNHAAILLPNGLVLVAGETSDSELYNPATGTFSATGGRLFSGPPTATLLRDGKVLVIGYGAGPERQKFTIRQRAV